MRKQKLYSRIPTPALPGSGLRDMRKRNLSRSPSAPVFDCLWSAHIIPSDRRCVKEKINAIPLANSVKTAKIVGLTFLPVKEVSPV